MKVKKKQNKSNVKEECPVTYCMGLIGGKWKPVILYMVSKKVNRFGLLQKAIEGISKQMLTKQLRELEADGILKRVIYPEIPPRVEYFITEKGETLFPIVKRMKKWGVENMPKEKQKEV